MAVVTKRHGEALLDLFAKDKKRFVLERQHVMDEVVLNLNLKSYNYPLKRIVDKIRHYVTNFVEKDGEGKIVSNMPKKQEVKPQ